MSDAQVERFQSEGYLGPIALLSPRECNALARYLEGYRQPTIEGWHKGAAVRDWLLYRVAASPPILDMVRKLIGDDVVLWGCSVVRRRARECHPWHVDIETSAPGGRYVSAWIGLENIDRSSGLQFIAGSHLIGKTVQQIQAEHGCRRGEASDETVLAWAREHQPRASFRAPELFNGEAVLFDGGLWHGSRNDEHRGVRSALLLQFASADSPIRAHAPGLLEWPFEILRDAKPPTILLHGKTRSDSNRVEPAPVSPKRKRCVMLSTAIKSLEMPLQEQPGGGWRPYQLFGGSTPVVDHMNCHASVLSAGHSPHPPHAHHEEELLIVLDGEAELIIAEGPSEDGARKERVGRGALAYYPAFQHHTIRNVGHKPLTYLMFKWHMAGARAAPDALGANIFRFGKAEEDRGGGWCTKTIFEHSTNLLGRLQCHVSQMEPGASYAAHRDAYDIGIVTLSGTLETLGEEVPPNSAIYYAAGRKHGMRNPGAEPAHYIVFEFEGAAIDIAQRVRRRLKPIAKRALKRAAATIGVDLGKVRERLAMH